MKRHQLRTAACALLAATQITAVMGGLPVAYAAQQETAQLEPRMASAMPTRAILIGTMRSRRMRMKRASA